MNPLASPPPRQTLRFRIMNLADTAPQLGWFCLRARPRREFTVAGVLRQRVGVEVFAPRIKTVTTNRCGSSGLGMEALFPGYLFARFVYPHQLRHVVSTAGVNGVVKLGRETPAIADGVIEFLRAQVRLVDDNAPVFEEGAWVRIVGGCFRESAGRVLSADSGSDRVRVLLTLLGREIQVSIPARQLVADDPGRNVYPPALRAS